MKKTELIQLIESIVKRVLKEDIEDSASILYNKGNYRVYRDEKTSNIVIADKVTKNEVVIPVDVMSDIMKKITTGNVYESIKSKETKKLANLIESILKRVLKESNYNEGLNNILEPKADTELKNILTADEYNQFFKDITRLDNKASERAIDSGESYFPLDTLKDAIAYLENYFGFFNNFEVKYPKLNTIFEKIKSKVK